MRILSLLCASLLIAPLSAQATPGDFTFMCVDQFQLYQASEASCHRVNYSDAGDLADFCEDEYGYGGNVHATYSEAASYSSFSSRGDYAGYGPDACVDHCLDLSYDTDQIDCRTRGRPFDER